MGAKDIRLAPISRQDADRLVKLHHYSGKVVNNSQLHIGVFIGGQCEGALQFGPSLDKRKAQGLVKGTPWNGFIELNRMAFGPALPRNSESRALAVAMKILRRQYPFIQWVISFADATQCGDGTIYRASGFVLTGIKKNTQMWEAPEGEVFSRTSLTDGRSKNQQRSARAIVSRKSLTGQGSQGAAEQQRRIKGAILESNPGANVSTGGASMKVYKEAGFKPLVGFQLRYVFFLDPTARERLTVPVLPFSAIDDAKAGMYLGRPKQANSGVQPESGGAEPTPDAPITRDYRRKGSARHLAIRLLTLATVHTPRREPPMNATHAVPFVPRTFGASERLGRLKRLLWTHTHSSEKQEDARGRRHVLRGSAFVEVDLLTEAEIVALLPAGLAS